MTNVGREKRVGGLYPPQRSSGLKDQEGTGRGPELPLSPGAQRDLWAQWGVTGAGYPVPTPAHLQHLGIVTLDSVVEDRLSVVVGDVHLGMAILHQLPQDLPVTLAAGQVQGCAALLIFCAVGAATGRTGEVSGQGTR